MKQYCRYCTHLHAGNGIWSDEKQKEMSEATAKSVNNCKLFDFCEMDAFGETDGYKPRQHTIDEIETNQMRMNGV